MNHCSLWFFATVLLLFQASSVYWTLLATIFYKIRYQLYLRTIASIIREFDRHYLCGYDLYSMVDADFMGRFGKFCQEGFCFTFSAAIMLSLRRIKTAQLVRGEIPEVETVHSWVELRAFGMWWVIDPCWYKTCPFLRRYMHYEDNHPENIVRYSYAKIWHDPMAKTFYEHLSCSEKSHIFVELWSHYTPDVTGGFEIRKLNHEPYEISPGTRENYRRFDFDCQYHNKFCQEVIDELMAKADSETPLTQ